MTISREQIALNAIQWISLPALEPGGEDRWLYSDPAFRADYPRVLGEIASAGFGAAMMEVLDTQTLQDHARMIADAGLRLAPGYAPVALPEDHGVSLASGSPEWVRWFDLIRRRAEESNFAGLSTIFLAPEIHWGTGARRAREQAAVGYGFDRDRLQRMTEHLHESATILRAEGIRAGLHQHVGTWVETEAEIEHVLDQIDADVLGASFDIGHLAWAGMDPAVMISRHRHRIVDIHLKDLDLTIAADSRAHPVPYNATARRRFFLEPGLGDIDFGPVLAALGDDFEGWIIVEVDRASMDPDESARVSWRWVESTFPVQER